MTVIKQNQPDAWQAIDQLFQAPPLDPADRPVYTYAEKGHGRREGRTLVSSTELNQYVRWSGVQQVLQRTCRRVNLQTGEVEKEVTYGLTSLSRKRVRLKHVEQFWRWHWTIENRHHYVRDVTLGEDQCQVHTGAAAKGLGNVPPWGPYRLAAPGLGKHRRRAASLRGLRAESVGSHRGNRNLTQLYRRLIPLCLRRGGLV